MINGAWIPININNVNIVGNNLEKDLATAGGTPAGRCNSNFLLFSKTEYSSIDNSDDIMATNIPWVPNKSTAPYEKIINPPNPIRDAINGSLIFLILAKE